MKMLNLNFSKLVNIGLYTLKMKDFVYEHNLFLIEDANIDSKYYLINISRNITNIDILKNIKDDILLESLSISEISLKKDIPTQIALLLLRLELIEDLENVIEKLKSINISFFEVRYNFYKNERIKNLENIQNVNNILCVFSKIKTVDANGVEGAIVEDIGLFTLKKCFLKLDKNKGECWIYEKLLEFYREIKG